jgi:hypothetical protein
MEQEDKPSTETALARLRRWAHSPAVFALPFIGGIGVGVLLRLIFSDEDGGIFSAMSCGFVIGAPLLVGAVTVFIAEQLEPRTWIFYARAGMTSVLLFVLGTMLIAIEGLICAVLISPLLAMFGALGGLIMGAAFRLGRHVWHTMQVLALLPAVLLFFESGRPLPVQVNAITRSVYVNASPQAIWPHLLDVENIDPGQFADTWAFRIGVPTPISAVTSELDVPTRRVRMAKHVYFDQIAMEMVANDRVRWAYRFYNDSFPPGAMDDHVRIGGRYFDLLDTEYSLHAEGGRTRLQLTLRYRLSTRFNWYAAPVLKRLLGNAAEAYLDLYRARAEAART